MTGVSAWWCYSTEMSSPRPDCSMTCRIGSGGDAKMTLVSSRSRSTVRLRSTNAARPTSSTDRSSARSTRTCFGLVASGAASSSRRCATVPWSRSPASFTTVVASVSRTMQPSRLCCGVSATLASRSTSVSRGAVRESITAWAASQNRAGCREHRFSSGRMAISVRSCDQGVASTATRNDPRKPPATQRCAHASRRTRQILGVARFGPTIEHEHARAARDERGEPVEGLRDVADGEWDDARYVQGRERSRH